MPFPLLGLELFIASFKKKNVGMEYFQTHTKREYVKNIQEISKKIESEPSMGPSPSFNSYGLMDDTVRPCPILFFLCRFLWKRTRGSQSQLADLG